MSARERQPAGFAPAKRSLGQNFLVDENISRKIVAALDLQPGDQVLEIGPGRGALTKHIMATPGLAAVRVLERDDALADALADAHPELDVVRGDAMAYDWSGLAQQGVWKLVSNLPYNIASPLIWDIVSQGSFARAVFMVQLEVAQRLVAPPGGKEYGALSVFVQNHARGELLFKVPPQVFRPQPKVTSGVLRFFLRQDRPGVADAQALASMLRLCFQKRRKQLGTILKSLDISDTDDRLRRIDINPVQRPETLAPEHFLAMAKAFCFDIPA